MCRDLRACVFACLLTFACEREEGFEMGGCCAAVKVDRQGEGEARERARSVVVFEDL